MAIVKTGEGTEYVAYEFIMDSVDEFASLPPAHPGSTAICPAAGVIYFVNASGQWVEFGAGE